MSQSSGRKLPLSVSRRFMCDLMHVTRPMALVPMERHLRLAPLVEARARLVERPGWCAIFTKAYARVALDWPQLRQAYISLPRPHFYENATNVAAVAIERVIDGESAVLFAQVRRPEKWDLPALDRLIHDAKEAPLESLALYRRAMRIGWLPGPVRRALWWYAFHGSGKQRIQNAGTFGVSITAGEGASQLSLLSPMTTTLHYGQFSPDGSLPVRITFDHRVLDGVPIARILVQLEKELLTNILAEIRTLPLRLAA